LASTTLVPVDPADETSSPSVDVQDGEVDDDRMAVIRDDHKTQGLSDNAINYLAKGKRFHTNKVYDLYWKTWTIWCRGQTPPLDPKNYNPLAVLNFLTSQQSFSYSTLNGLRSSIASVYRILHPSAPPIVEVEIIQEFFRAKKLQVKIRTTSQLQTWDTDIIVHHNVSTYVPSTALSLYGLQQKAALLLCLSTMP
jgi:hypothetical protein